MPHSKEIMKIHLTSIFSLKDKTFSDIWTVAIKGIDFTPTKLSRENIFYQKARNLIETLMIK